jgi:hypothetical protein
MSVNSNTIAVSATLPSPENTFYGNAAPTTTSGYTVGDTWYVTPLGNQADASNATAEYRFDGISWVKTPSGASPTITYGTVAPTGTAATGSEYFITSTGTNGGTITASYIFDGTTWKLRPSAAAATGGQNVYIDTTSPSTATIFDIENPPVTNNNALKNDDANTYYGTDGSVWTWNGTAYVTKTYNIPTERYTQSTATANQTAFTLPSIPIGSSTLTAQKGIVHVTRNGVDISRAWSWVGANGTYTAADNYSCVIDAGDNLQFHWEAL